MDLCLEELVTNSIKYGHDPIASEEQLIRVTVQNLGEIVRLTIVDKANAFDPCKSADKVLPENVMEAEIGGLGLLLVRKLTHRLAYERDGDANIMVLEFASPAADA
jgi:anti-sigma regulatory factor (Ser/Thr protein kinase)